MQWDYRRHESSAISLLTLYLLSSRREPRLWPSWVWAPALPFGPRSPGGRFLAFAAQIECVPLIG